jgi:hypothetical protein
VCIVLTGDATNEMAKNLDGRFRVMLIVVGRACLSYIIQKAELGAMRQREHETFMARAFGRSRQRPAAGNSSSSDSLWVQVTTGSLFNAQGNSLTGGALNRHEHHGHLHRCERWPWGVGR